ncbi:MAG: hypothetical protein FDZ69_01775 [Deltaproteobacteria bacterium]|nr:MAG: hypothetical protein FDZ69_01775 [Deltaproteobacteria bacterium]
MNPLRPVLSLPALLAGLLFAVLLSTSAFAASLPPDDYLGDAAIYTGVPGERPKPNILLIIDTSQATLSPAPGKRYNPADPEYNTGTYVANRIYYSDQQGDFTPSKALGGNSPVLVSGVSCVVKDGTGATVLDVKATLSTYGTYSGSGAVEAPNLSNTGACDTAPNGAVYATGHYLNYTTAAATSPATGTCDGRTVVIKLGVWPGGGASPKPKKYKLISNIVGSSVAAQQPGVGADWEKYWTLLAKTDTTAITHEVNAAGQFVAGYTGRDGWKVGLLSLDPVLKITCVTSGAVRAKPIGYWSWDLYTEQTSATPQTQRQSFYDALVPVIQGASSSVNFGFVTYNPNNQGAVIGKDILSPTAPASEVQALIDKLPKMSTCSRGTGASWNVWTCPDTIASGPNRPQSEALYDAGYYFKATYKKTDGSAPNKQSINLTSQVPNPNLCGYNHIILLTNGLPNKDSGTPNLGDWDGDNYGDETVYGLGTHLLDDVAAYLQNQADVNGDGKTGDVTTHVVLAFQAEDTLLRNTARVGGGEFYNVFDTQGLSNALLNILANIVKEADTAFVAPVVPASSTNRTRSGERVYLGLFKPQTNATWQGNLKKYKLSSENDLLDVHGKRATNAAGDFIYSQSFWGTGTVDVNGVATTVIRAAEGDRNVVPDTYSPSYDANGNPLSFDPDGGDGGIVNAGGVGGSLLARDPSTRKIFTVVGNSKVYLRTKAANGAVSYGLTPTQLGFEAAETLKRSQLIDFLYGYDSYGTTYAVEGQAVDKRKWMLGDILHSKPLVRSYWKYKEEQESTCYDESNPGSMYDAATGYAKFNSTVIYVGVNDGMLHAFNDCNGSELWAFVPPILLDKLKNLPDGTHEFYADSSPSTYVYDANENGNIEGNDKVILVFGLRRGGGHAYLTPNTSRGAYYMLDVTDPRNPQYLGEISSNNAGLGEMGETWSQPVIRWVKDGTIAKLAMFVGAGYDNNEDRRWGATQSFPVSTWSDDGNFANDTDTTIASNDGTYNNGLGVTSDGGGSQLNPKGRGIYIIELARIVSSTGAGGATAYSLDASQAGSLVKAFTSATVAGMNFSIPSDLIVLDWDRDGFSDRVYAGDTGGQLWAFDLTDKDEATGNDKNQWAARMIFNANPGSDGTVGRKFFYRPDVGRDGDLPLLFIGSGDREHPLNRAVKDRLYMIRDRGQTTAAKEGNLKDLTANELQNSSDPQVVSTILSELASDTNYGWYVRLEGSGEKMLADPVLFFGDALFTTYKPLPPILDTCEVGNLGVAQLYQMDYENATAVVNYDRGNDSNYESLAEDSLAKGKDGAVLMKTDRVVTLGEGIPSGIVVLIDKKGKISLKVAASGKVTDIKPGSLGKLGFPIYWTETILDR